MDVEMKQAPTESRKRKSTATTEHNSENLKIQRIMNTRKIPVPIHRLIKLIIIIISKANQLYFN